MRKCCVVERPPLIVFADDWGRHPSSAQHLVRQWLDRYKIHWINTIGTRTPRFDLATCTRAFEKLRGWLRSPRSVESLPANLHVANPRMWPWFTRSLDRRINRLLLTRQLGKLIQTMKAPPVVITTIPIVADLIDRLPVRRWVYYCVDDFGQWPGLDQAPLRQMEEHLVRNADVIIAASETLCERLEKMGGAPQLLTHGVDLKHWGEGAEGGTPLPEVARLEKPLVVFWGLIDQRMDAALVRRLAADMTEGTIVLVGPVADPSPALFESNRVVRLPVIPYDALPHLARVAGVLVMPYADLPVTRAMQPLKLKEYLATGKPAVVRDLPATRDWADCLDCVDTPEAFSRVVRSRLKEGLPEHQERARLRLTSEGWPEKARLFERWALTVESGHHAVACH
jgi:hypothetical protein